MMLANSGLDCCGCNGVTGESPCAANRYPVLQCDEMTSAVQLWQLHKLRTNVFGLGLIAAV